MRHRVLYVPTCLSFAVVVSIAALAEAQPTAPGPYYVPPAWDTTLPAATRYINLSNMNSEAVLVRETGLVWERQPSNAPHTWTFADSQCRDAVIGGRRGWRLPRLEELQSLMDPSTAAPALPPGHPFVVAPILHTVSVFSATTIPPSALPQESRVVRMVSLATGESSLGGSVPQSELFNTLGARWCVRGGAPQ